MHRVPLQIDATVVNDTGPHTRISAEVVVDDDRAPDDPVLCVYDFRDAKQQLVAHVEVPRSVAPGAAMQMIEDDVRRQTGRPLTKVEVTWRISP